MIIFIICPVFISIHAIVHADLTGTEMENLTMVSMGIALASIEDHTMVATFGKK